MNHRWLKRCDQFALVLIPSSLLVSRKPNRFGAPVRSALKCEAAVDLIPRAKRLIQARL